MPDQILYVFILGIVALPVVAFRWQLRRIRGGVVNKLKGIGMYAVYAALPVASFVGLYLVIVGLEEMIDKSLLSEGMARSMIPVVGWGVIEVIVLTALFAVVVMFVGRRKDA